MTQTHRKEAVLFDMDGVLFSTDEYHYRSWQELGAAHGVPLARETFDQRMRGLERPAALAVFLEASDRPFSAAERMALAVEKQERFLEIVQREGVRPLPGVVELIAELKRAGATIAVGSSSRNTRPLLEAAGLLSQFAAVVDANDCRAKPEPDIYLEAARRIAVTPERCVVIEDALDGIEAARRAGMAVLAVGPAERFTDVKYRVPSLVGVRAEWLISMERETR
jgi:beta-phosphoglucomutase